VVMVLTPATPHEVGPGLKRVRLHFRSDEQCELEFKIWLQQTARQAPEDPHALIQWWPGFKQQMANSLNR
jgi:hypothetical protein